jgi:hypothetical protein
LVAARGIIVAGIAMLATSLLAGDHFRRQFRHFVEGWGFSLVG